jgi:hypothetical protein
MLRLLLADINFNNNIVRGLLRRNHNLDIMRAQDIGLEGKEDDVVLEFAANTNRILLTHDASTVPEFAYARIQAGDDMPGVFIVNDLSIGAAIEELLLLTEASSPEDWQNIVAYLPV